MGITCVWFEYNLLVKTYLRECVIPIGWLQRHPMGVLVPLGWLQPGITWDVKQTADGLSVEVKTVKLAKNIYLAAVETEAFFG
jgi:hypothetical protein